MPPHRITWKNAWPWLLALAALASLAALAGCLPNTDPLVVAAVDGSIRETTPLATNASAGIGVEELTSTAKSLVSSTATAIPPTATAAPTSTPVPSATPEPTSTPEPTETPAPTPTPEAPRLFVKADLLRVRSGPGTAYPDVGLVRAGESFTITAKSEDGKWWKIEVAGQNGWVSGEWAQANEAAQAVAAIKAAPPPTLKAPSQPRPATAAAASQPKKVPAPKPAGAGFFAVGIQIDPGGDLGTTIGAVKGLGINWVKFQLPWKHFEGTPGVRNFPDDIVNALNSNGVNILASIVKAPDWARPAGTDLSVEGPPARPQDYANYVGEFAARYCGRVQAIEVWNEQNLWYEWGGERLDARRYIQLLAPAYNAIKAACPSMIVVSGALTPTGAPLPWAIRDTTYLEQMYQAGLKRYSDAIGVHPSGYGNPPDARVQDFQAGNFSRPSHVNDSSFYFRNTMEQYRNIMAKYGDGNKRLWPTEFGWASAGVPVAGYEYAAYNSEQDQGAYIVRAFEMMRRWGFVGVAFLWNLNYNTTQPGSEMAAFGILGRPAYGALQALPK